MTMGDAAVRVAAMSRSSSVIPTSLAFRHRQLATLHTSRSSRPHLCAKAPGAALSPLACTPATAPDLAPSRARAPARTNDRALSCAPRSDPALLPSSPCRRLPLDRCPCSRALVLFTRAR
ncbi:hypothetical protein AMAG_17766 [Allomyces macrogynus ATCC 38327]|uniref:Uncharacterized protein n=1 Tax=Allomyces macrogynus (strain ATCC 38327) TaxID=578462 RepID=A0A0L0RY49_ALLM3|nr:hypothetical protein, variant [Allomyces macrogynus ATCC 38327]KNE55289.1 hypothetical protein AMAG_17766 [Allomyces macrogynus ATCC 38327]|eukprot:KNE55288.1 hypothetical protein, variant [Allomyces macrogynus ATCC 38327]